MKIASHTFNPIGEQTYVVWDSTGECVIIDAGNSNDRENRALDELIALHSLRPVMAINTHGHFDHTLGVEYVKERYNIPFALSRKDQFLLDNAQTSGSVFGVKIGRMPQIDIDLDSLDEVKFGESTLKILRTPGHTPGHVAFFSAEDGVVFTGDTLFRESIGRTDLPGGDYSWIMTSILRELIPLGDEVKVYPGHGPETTIGHESMYNPFVVEVLNEQVNYKDAE